MGLPQRAHQRFFKTRRGNRPPFNYVGPPMLMSKMLGLDLEVAFHRPNLKENVKPTEQGQIQFTLELMDKIKKVVQKIKRLRLYLGRTTHRVVSQRYPRDKEKWAYSCLHRLLGSK